MRKSLFVAVVLVIGFSMIVGCSTTYNVNRVSEKKLAREGTIVFVRPTKYTPLRVGTKSLGDYLEVTYERASFNQADLLEVQVGLRNRGGQHFWDLVGPNFALSVKTTFYDGPFPGGGAFVYETNWQRVPMLRGATTRYRTICPMKTGTHYQVTISEPIN